ncbi:serine/threonine protein kinase [Streptomyces sp. NWU339]|uniref:serine/threonine-protein kinase n=1 Tax=Streptomyces sp. NWU339 TaxID=2185284 RepID=UPI000D678BAA|nr:serine/threonine-protein kinase [Streptomyces sp. NWU339]PWI11366.1 serine/threonine protein kinase [Streptomyces sp. NWU339]
MRPLDVDEPAAVGPYRLLGRLGAGGMGRVYLGRSAGGRTVAVKIVHPHFALDEEFRARFRREVEAARRVGGAWTAPVLDADPDARVPWVATAYAAGPPLTAAVTHGGPLPAHTVRALGAGLGEALAAVHELGLVHRDVKPSNVLLTLDGPLLIDFGITRAMDGTASLTSSGVSIGSPGYMAPEQVLGKGVTGAADVFSLGAVLAYAATGEPPFRGDSSAALLYKVVHEPPELGDLGGRDGPGDQVRELVAACLDKDPGARPTPAEVARRLAPEGGAARLVAGGWLPGALVEQVSRSAVRLLHLEAGRNDAATAGPESGPVDFSSPSVDGTGPAGSRAPGTSGASGASGSGAFGPPPVMPERPVPTAASDTSVAPAHPLTSAAVPGPRATHPPTRPDGGHRPGRLSVSVAATSDKGQGGRGRRMSCTVALAVAGALAAVTVGSVFVLDLLPGDSAGSDRGAQPEAPAAVVPTAYLGTWEGQANSREGIAIPLGTFRVTVEQAEVGEQVATLRHTDIFGGVCDDVLTLKQVTKKRLVATSVGAKSNRDVCNQARHTVHLTPTGDDLVYESDSKDSGSPEARLSKIG